MAIVRERESNGVPGVPILLFLLAAEAPKSGAWCS